MWLKCYVKIGFGKAFSLLSLVWTEIQCFSDLVPFLSHCSPRILKPDQHVFKNPTGQTGAGQHDRMWKVIMELQSAAHHDLFPTIRSKTCLLCREIYHVEHWRRFALRSDRRTMTTTHVSLTVWWHTTGLGYLLEPNFPSRLWLRKPVRYKKVCDFRTLFWRFHTSIEMHNGLFGSERRPHVRSTPELTGL